ncbi:hypothetical protein C2E23DRAFT_834003 [Lenzites betulinus]|nr:hypothetical protein C2E23DRAFT_834003 [Lenzites betulinus]
MDMSHIAGFISSPSPALPTELIIQILEETARASYSGARAVSLLCSWARAIALPYLFATIVHESRPLSFQTTLSSGKATSQLRPRPSVPLRWGHFVRNLWNLSSVPQTPADNVFLACPNVENLALLPSHIHIVLQALKEYNASTAQHADSQSSATAPSGYPFLQRLRSITLITHTFRFQWEPLVGVQLQNGTRLCHNITHLRMLSLKVSEFCPYNLLPNLTHLALPYLDVVNNLNLDRFHLPGDVLKHRALTMLVLTVDEHDFTTNPRHEVALYPPQDNTSPKNVFRTLVRLARERDDRLHVFLSPRQGVERWEEWAHAACGGSSLWEEAAEARARDSHGEDLPDSYPRRDRPR